MSETVAFKLGQHVRHAQHGEGVVLDSERNGFIRTFFERGEWFVAVASLQPFLSRTNRVISSVVCGKKRRHRA